MRKLSEQDISAIIGSDISGSNIIQARIKNGHCSDSDHYGILLGVSASGKYVTWQFHLIDEQPSVYWGHYFMENKDSAIQDFNTRE